MKVRATKDGTYGGFYREGPIDGVPGVSPGSAGEVFEIDEKPYAALDPETGRPVMEPVLDARGNVIIDTIMMQAVDEKGNPVVGADKKAVMVPTQRDRMRPKMWSWFSPEWMEKVPSDTPVTYEDNAGSRGVHASMKIKKASSQSTPRVSSELSEEFGKPIEDVKI